MFILGKIMFIYLIGGVVNLLHELGHARCAMTQGYNVSSVVLGIRFLRFTLYPKMMGKRFRLLLSPIFGSGHTEVEFIIPESKSDREIINGIVEIFGSGIVANIQLCLISILIVLICISESYFQMALGSSFCLSIIYLLNRHRCWVCNQIMPILSLLSTPVLIGCILMLYMNTNYVKFLIENLKIFTGFGLYVKVLGLFGIFNMLFALLQLLPFEGSDGQMMLRLSYLKMQIRKKTDA